MSMFSIGVPFTKTMKFSCTIGGIITMLIGYFTMADAGLTGGSESRTRVNNVW